MCELMDWSVDWSRPQHANMPTSFWNLVPVPNSAWIHIQTHPNLNMQRRHDEYRNDKKWLIWHPRLLMISMVLIECQAQSCWNTEACNLLWALRRQRHRRRWTSQNSRAAEERPKMTKRSNKALVNIYIYIYVYVCIYIYVFVYIYIQMVKCLSIYTVYICTSICTYIYIYVRIYTL
jgi:hypothetical protein